jgi:exocyst complex component 4
MPGLVQSSENTIQAALSTFGADDRLLGAGQHHRLIIRPDAFHVSVLFQPTLAWLDRVSDVLPSGVESARESTTVLDDFVLKVYLPQLEEKVSFLFHQAVTGTDQCLPSIVLFLNKDCRPRGVSTGPIVFSSLSRTFGEGI